MLDKSNEYTNIWGLTSTHTHIIEYQYQMANNTWNTRYIPIYVLCECISITLTILTIVMRNFKQKWKENTGSSVRTACFNSVNQFSKFSLTKFHLFIFNPARYNFGWKCRFSTSVKVCDCFLFGFVFFIHSSWSRVSQLKHNEPTKILSKSIKWEVKKSES